MSIDANTLAFMSPARMIRIQAVFTKLGVTDNRPLAIRELHRTPDRALQPELAVKQESIPITRHDQANQSPWRV